MLIPAKHFVRSSHKGNDRRRDPRPPLVEGRLAAVLLGLLPVQPQRRREHYGQYPRQPQDPADPRGDGIPEGRQSDAEEAHPVEDLPCFVMLRCKLAVIFT